MKKFRITDEDGAKYEVEEIEEEVVDEDVEVEPEEGEHSGNEALTPDEIASLKQLAAAAPAILALLDKGEEPIEDEEVEEEVEEEIDEDDLDEVEEDEMEEEVIDSEKTKAKDSKKSYGSIEKRKKLEDSIDAEEEIANAWAKRYGGK